MPNWIRVLHISDLHFVENLAVEPRGLYARAIYILKAKPHSFGKLDAFRAKIEQRTLAERRAIDLVLATGDLTTNGDQGAFETVRRFINDASVYAGNPSRLLIEGLGASDSRRVLLPGNHDRYQRNWLPVQTRSDTFEIVLGTPRQYPYVVGYRPADWPNDKSSPALLFFVFDSTPSVVVSLKPLSFLAPRRFRPWEITARGRVEAAECRELVRLSRELENTQTVRGVDGSTMNIHFASCIRIAVLHHHPLDRQATTLMENHDKFLEYCFRAGVDLVLFGHDHREYNEWRYGDGPYDVASVGDPHRIHLFCCPSTSEFSSRNGFYLFNFYWEGRSATFDFELYEWGGLPAADFILTRRANVPFKRDFG